MCGRAYETYSDEELYFRYLSKRPLTPLVLSPIYNLCPTQNSPVLRLVAGERQFDQKRWQLVPTTEPAFTTQTQLFFYSQPGGDYDCPECLYKTLRRSATRCPVCHAILSADFEWPFSTMTP